MSERVAPSHLKAKKTLSPSLSSPPGRPQNSHGPPAPLLLGNSVAMSDCGNNSWKQIAALPLMSCSNLSAWLSQT